MEYELGSNFHFLSKFFFLPLKFFSFRVLRLPRGVSIFGVALV